MSRRCSSLSCHGHGASPAGVRAAAR
ncbi:MAG: CxxxxCH/CxxCH domain-containing protein [Myxococcales bacterium]|nr:CxxxxCH/CxxCH domain-containing protein [Myxococcales bacterium]